MMTTTTIQQFPDTWQTVLDCAVRAGHDGAEVEYLLNERAGIREHDGHQPRDVAERLAAADVAKVLGQAADGGTRT